MSTSQIVLVTVTESCLQTSTQICTDLAKLSNDTAQLPHYRNLDKVNRDVVRKPELKIPLLKGTTWLAFLKTM